MRYLVFLLVSVNSPLFAAKFLGTVEQKPSPVATPLSQSSAQDLGLELGISGSPNRFDGRARVHFRRERTVDFPLTVTVGQGNYDKSSYNYSTIESGILMRWTHAFSQITPWLALGPGVLQWTNTRENQGSNRQLYAFGQLGFNVPLSDHFFFSCWQEFTNYSNIGRPASLGGNQKRHRALRYSFSVLF